MTDMEIPQAAIEAAAMAIGDMYEHPPDDYRPDARHALEAALPHLLTEVKSMCETATAIALALGRKAATEEIQERLRFLGIHVDIIDGQERCGCIIGPDHTRADHANLSSRPPQVTSNGLTASSRHPGTPEDTKPPQEAL